MSPNGSALILHEKWNEKILPTFDVYSDHYELPVFDSDAYLYP
jgi:hypothetical protein